MPSSNDILIISELKSLINQELYNHVLNQVEKDFLLCGLEFDDIKDKEANLFLSNLNHKIGLYLRDSPEKLRMLLYRVDVKESEITDLFDKNENEMEIVNQISGLILIREIMKVRSRQNYI